jgi:solute:Na+ symporter, SSS family
MLSSLDIGIVLVFLLYAAIAGLRARERASRDLDEYFLAGRTLPGWKAGISMAATQFAADTPLLVTGLIATAGIFSLWRLWIYALAFLFMGFVLGAAWRRARVLTDAELAELRYGTRLSTVLRAAKAIYFGTVFNCTVMAMVLFAATRIAEPFLVWHEWLPTSVFEGVVDLVQWSGLSLTSIADPATWAERSASNLLSLVLVVGVTALYSTTGGLRAVVNTDLVQFAIAMLATLVYGVIVVREIGGLAAIPVRLHELYGSAWALETLAFTPSRARDVSWIFIGTIAIQWVAQMNADGTGYLAQRTMACRSDRDARQAAIVFTVAQVLVRSLFWIPIGLGLLVLLPMDASAPVAAEREASFVAGMARYLPAGALGLMLTGMLAALASTIDTHLNWGASYWTNDIYRRLLCQGWRGVEPSPRSLVWVARFSNLLVLALAVAILVHLESIQSAWQTSLLLGAGMGAPLILRWVWWRVTAGGELAAIAVSCLLAPLLLHYVPNEGARMLCMTIATSIVVVAFALWAPAAPSEPVKAFYRRVRPPGFWGPVARECGEDATVPEHALYSGLLTAATATLAIFSLLVAAGSWLFGSPPPTWFPWRGPWIASLLFIASVLSMRLWLTRAWHHPVDQTLVQGGGGP